MAHIAVLGATGMLGTEVTRLAAAAGHEVTAASRGGGRADAWAGSVAAVRADAVTGEGLDTALSGADAVVVAVNARKDPEATLVGAVHRAAQTAPGATLVIPSIAGCDHVGVGYFRAKVAQERAARSTGSPVAVLRIAQFHEFVADLLAQAARAGVSPRGAFRIRPVETSAAAAEVVAAALDGPTDGIREIVGPERATLSELSRAWSRSTSTRRLPVHIPRSLLRIDSDNALCGGDDATVLGPGFSDWLATATSVGPRP